MMKIFGFLAGLFTVAVSQSFEEQVDAIRVAYRLPALGAATLIPGAALNMTMTGYRRINTTDAALVNDLFHVGSCGKAMTATVVATLIEAGLLSWTTTLAEMLPEMTDMHPDYRTVTVEMILAHRSGMTDDITSLDGGKLWGLLYRPGFNPTLGRQMVASKVLSIPPTIAPGTAFLYSNAGYTTMGHIVEKLLGQRWEDIVPERLFKPLGITDFVFGVPLSDTDPTAYRPSPHLLKGEDVVTKAWGPTADNPPTIAPAGTMSFTVDAWNTFLMLHLQGALGQPTPILSPATFTKLHTPYPGQDYTPGAWIRTDRDWAGGYVLTHTGSNNMNLATVWIAPGVNAVLTGVTNCGGDLAHDGVDAAITLLIPAVQKGMKLF